MLALRTHAQNVRYSAAFARRKQRRMRRRTALQHITAVKHERRFSGKGLSLKEGAAILGCSPRTLARHIKDGDLPAYDIKKRGAKRRALRVTREALERFRNAAAYDSSEPCDS